MYTVNKKYIKGLFLSPLFYFLFPLFLSGQNINNYFVSKTQENYKLYFINPQDYLYSKDLKEHLLFDYTFLSNQDSILFNFSVALKNNIKLDSIKWITNDVFVFSSIRPLYVDFKKNKWVYRYSSKISYLEWKKIINKEDFKIALISSDKQLSFELKSKKPLIVLRKIIEIIDVNNQQYIK